jgi:hypothetical protein
VTDEGKLSSDKSIAPHLIPLPLGEEDRVVLFICKKEYKDIKL